jgi:hypothetical protein
MLLRSAGKEPSKAFKKPAKARADGTAVEADGRYDVAARVRGYSVTGGLP